MYLNMRDTTILTRCSEKKREELLKMYSNTENAIILASKWYSKDKLAHAMRVANYAIQEARILNYDSYDIEEIFQVAILHDILEDTECPKEEIVHIVAYDVPIAAIERLTHQKEDSYEEYIKKLVDNSNIDMNINTQVKSLAYALIVKRADMKDHLMLEDTLTDKLKKKYYPIMKYLL